MCVSGVCFFWGNGEGGVFLGLGGGGAEEFAIDNIGCTSPIASLALYSSVSGPISPS